MRLRTAPDEMHPSRDMAAHVNLHAFGRLLNTGNTENISVEDVLLRGCLAWREVHAWGDYKDKVVLFGGKWTP